MPTISQAGKALRGGLRKQYNVPKLRHETSSA
jgi:hypothetical protein